MIVRKVWLLAITIGMTGHGFAQEPTPAQTTPAAAPTPATAAPRPVNAMPAAKLEEAPATVETKREQEAAAKPAALEGELDQDKIMAAQKAGYELRNENGEVLLCRKDLRTGSRLRHTVSCMTPRQWEQLQSDTAQTLRSIERRRVGPANN